MTSRKSTLAGEKNLHNLLRSLSPELIEGEFVFCTCENSGYGDHPETRPIAAFTEAEGLTLVVPRDAADSAGITYEQVFRCITLGVHSSLDAVGLTAAVAGELAAHGISANVIAAYYHDHIFIEAQKAQRAIGILLNYKDTTT
jgi:hypothetical protein